MSKEPRDILIMPALGYYVARNTMNKKDEPRAFTVRGEFIGTPSQAASFASQEVNPEYIDPSHNICKIGYCRRSGKWYGWTTTLKRNVMVGFAVGDSTRSVMNALNNNKMKWRMIQLPTTFVARRPDDARLLASCFVQTAEIGGGLP